MTRETVDRIIEWLANTEIPMVDLTGGAPEMIPDFRYFIKRVKKLQPSRHVIDRCNLTILLEDGYKDLARFLADEKVEIIASMPCYSADNVNAQRGDGVFEGSIAALQLLNSLGYGIDSALPLHLVYNPVGAFLPAAQAELEAITSVSCKSISELCSTGFIRSRIFRSAGSALPCDTAINSMNTCSF